MRSQREGHVRIWKAKLEKHTHILGRAKGELSGHRKKGISRGTHLLERAEVGIGQNMESKQASKGHSHAGEGRGQNLSGNRMKVSQ